MLTDTRFFIEIKLQKLDNRLLYLLNTLITLDNSIQIDQQNNESKIK
jgi:hypothetical protein